MKEILDIVVFILFAIILAIFIIGFNRQQIEKHKNMLDENERKKEKDDKTTTS